MKKIKVLLVQERLMGYRLETYKEMVKREDIDLTLAYIIKTDIKPGSVDIPIVKIDYRKIGPFYFLKKSRRLFKNYDVVILLPHLKFPNLISKPFTHHKYKVITWSVGIRVSYDRKYDLEAKPDFSNWLTGQMIKRSDAAIFYMPDPIGYWEKHNGLDRGKCFVAHNTVPIAHYDNLPDYSTRRSFLFVGTLYRQKGIELLLRAYASAKERCENLYPLVVVGDGPEKQNILQLTNELGIENDVNFVGAVYDEEKLKIYHLNASLCVSPNQAGLSVLKSFGYGVPFVCRYDAITGGERLNIKDGVNGILYGKDEDLAEIFIDCVANPAKYSRMADNAREYYEKEASVKNMAKGATDAIDFVARQ